MAYLNGFLNPLIYVLKYVVKRSLANWITDTAARMKNSSFIEHRHAVALTRQGSPRRLDWLVDWGLPWPHVAYILHKLCRLDAGIGCTTGCLPCLDSFCAMTKYLSFLTLSVKNPNNRICSKIDIRIASQCRSEFAVWKYLTDLLLLHNL